MLMTVERVETQLRQWRCPMCRTRLFDANVLLREGQVIECWCRSCRRIVTFTGQPEVDESSSVA